MKLTFLTWSKKCITVTGDCVHDANKPEFEKTNTKLYVLVVTLSTQDNEKLPQQWKTGFKRTIKWNNKTDI